MAAWDEAYLLKVLGPIPYDSCSYNALALNNDQG